MFEISSDDIASLNDSELRALVGLLCEAELASHGLPTAGVTWGGSQDASDGGVDVRVSRASLPYSDGFIPKAQTIFQVKKPDMPPAAIGNEMCSGGALRDSIKEIAAQGGAYIIVSSAGTTTDSALKKRVQRMREIITDYALGCFVDFYDRNRLASWVRSYPGIAIWVREKCGRKLEGWKPYGNWANCPQV
ncbi:hypothetical protein [Desulfovibrio psychrotolerans]|uniref:Restriction endonuclease type IV Mrr domain-containing protein n=1 Tax=Desulfovibrio psychrotolerans TaxID=415242 RepID=A0A7J0BWH3_9BACT|nr:hypothetical protein [Desulfovibrio psychrotolerans]GFM38069.1 hypothetical protein DSM19430T_27530 [Desulfovibrio psychrotolerans]